MQKEEHTVRKLNSKDEILSPKQLKNVYLLNEALSYIFSLSKKARV
jgi:hypothetical protein